MEIKNVKLENNQNKISALWSAITDMLAREPRSYDTNDDPGFWTNGDEILCPSKIEADIVCQFLSDIFMEYGNFTLVTGWYDPFEDQRTGEQDECTDFCYVRLE